MLKMVELSRVGAQALPDEWGAQEKRLVLSSKGSARAENDVEEDRGGEEQAWQDSLKVVWEDV